MSAAPAASPGQHHRTGSLINWGFIKIEPMTASRGAAGFAQRTRDCRGRLAIRTISAVLLAMAGMVASVGVQVASETAVGAAYVSSFSINDPGSLSGTSGQAITPVEFIASNVDASTGPVATAIKWTAGQLPSGLSLSPAGVLSGTLSASIPGGLYDLRIIASERVTSGSRGLKSVIWFTTDLATQISISGPSVFSSNQTTIGSGFSYPMGVAVDTSGHIFVADYGNSRIVSMDADGSNQTTIGSGFSYPVGVAVDTSGHVFVADTFNSRIVSMNAGFRIPDQSVPGVQAGQAAEPTQLESESVDPSTAPKVTSVKWFASDLPAGLKLSSKGVLSGTPKVQLLGTYSIYLTATETVTKVVGKVKTVTTRATSQVLWVIVS